MFQIRNCLTKGLVAAALASAAFLHTPTAKAAATESVVYSFCSQANCTDGANPEAALTSINGILYGTTNVGGKHAGDCYGGCGTVFSLDPSTGTETVLHYFQDSTRDGALPVAGLIRFRGLLYGTTSYGGTGDCSYDFFGNCGTVFSINPATNKERGLHAFQWTDGAAPFAALTGVGGTLYGTTEDGGSNDPRCGSRGCGTVFAFNPAAGTEWVVHIFEKRGVDGRLPQGELVNVNGTLYGTTAYGGTGTCGSLGCGTVFSLNPRTGAVTVLYSFQDGTDGGFPSGGLISLNGTLYGTTYEGGIANHGTVFSIDPTTGVERVVHSFRANGLGGSSPVAGLISVNGTLFGTTFYGGTGTCGSAGCGTVFAINPTTGTERVLHSFQSDGADGYYPYASVIDIRGTLYGTTTGGGAHGQGAVFAITHWQ
jgi:uncharacterized repeat protein (TIGR03803 family)